MEDELVDDVDDAEDEDDDEYEPDDELTELELDELVREDEYELVDGLFFGSTLFPLMSMPRSYQEPSGDL